MTDQAPLPLSRYDKIVILEKKDWPPRTTADYTQIERADLVIMDDGSVKKDRFGHLPGGRDVGMLALARNRGLADQANLLWRLQEFSKREEAGVGIHFRSTSGDWMVELLWGKEAEDSPMTGAAAYGADPDLVAALTQALDEARA